MTRAPLSLSAGAVALAGACALWLGFPNDLASLPPLVLLWARGPGLVGRQRPRPGRSPAPGLALSPGRRHGGPLLADPAVHNVGGLPWALAVPAPCSLPPAWLWPAAFLPWRPTSCARRPPWLWAVVLGLCWFVLEDVFAACWASPG